MRALIDFVLAFDRFMAKPTENGAKALFEARYRIKYERQKKQH